MLHTPLVADPALAASSPPAAVPPPARDNLLGVCHAIGDALRIDPLVLRIAFAAGVLVNFEAAVAAYLGAALVMVLARR